jgi:NADPH:quinone reductase-like Zn-dependent oxidoreductase
MKAVHLRGSQQAPQLTCEQAPRPQAGDGEVLVRVHAAAVTPTELLWAPTWSDAKGAARPLPVIPGHELSGVVAGLGPGVHDLAVGDAVFGLNDWFRDGTQAELCVARASELAAKPRTLDHVQTASTPISALTAWQGLLEHARLAAGERVLIHGASGGVGVFAVQIARWRGARVIATAATRNVDFVRALGAEQVIDYATERFEDLVHDVDVVFDAVGGAVLERSWSVLKPDGRLVTVAASEEGSRSARTRAAFFIVEGRRAELAEIARLLDAGVVEAVVGGVFPIERAAEAYAFKALRGKTVLQVEG